MKELKSTFAERLNLALEMRDMKASELSRLSGVNEGAISQYRKGAYKANQYNLDKISRVLNVTVPWLMGLDEETPSKITERKISEDKLYQQFLDLKVTANELAMIDKYRQLDDDGKRMIDVMIDTRLAQLGDKTEEEEKSS